MSIHQEINIWMGREEFHLLSTSLKDARCYLEYGSGGSTLYAATIPTVSTIISVDSDPQWIIKTKHDLEQNNPTGKKIHLGHCDIGQVGKLGAPKDTREIHAFWKYMTLPWDIAKVRKAQPDLVLVDGRFRVASFLYSLLSAKEGTSILFDDYFNRPEYAVVEQFSKPRQRAGNMAKFIRGKTMPSPAICAVIAQYSIVWR